MGLVARRDASRPGGGFAVLSGAGLGPHLAFEDRGAGLFLGEDGKWSRYAHFFTVEVIDSDAESSAVRLGPSIVDFLAVDTPVAVHGPEGVVGHLVWPDIPPSAGGSGASSIVASAAPVPAAPEGSSEPEWSPEPELPPEPEEPVQAPQVQAPQVQAPQPSPAFPAEAPTPWGRAWKPLVGLLGVILIGIAVVAFGSWSKEQGGGETAAYQTYLQCVAGKEACAAQTCGASYLSAFPNAPRAREVNDTVGTLAQRCEVERRQKDGAEALGRCLERTVDPCQDSACIEQYRSKLTIEPYSSILRRATETASRACVQKRENDAYATFLRCMSERPPCEHATCGTAYFSATPNRAHAVEASRALQEADRACRELRTGRRDYDDFEACMRTTPDPCRRPECIERFRSRITPENLDRFQRQELDTYQLCNRKREDQKEPPPTPPSSTTLLDRIGPLSRWAVNGTQNCANGDYWYALEVRAGEVRWTSASGSINVEMVLSSTTNEFQTSTIASRKQPIGQHWTYAEASPKLILVTPAGRSQFFIGRCP